MIETPPQLAAFSLYAGPVIFIRFTVKRQTILLTKSRIVSIHLVDKVVVIFAQLHEGRGSPEMFSQFGIDDIPGKALR